MQMKENIKAPPHKWPVTRKMFPFDDVIMQESYAVYKFACSGTNVVTYGNKQPPHSSAHIHTCPPAKCW